MKKIFLLFFLSSLLLITSCKKSSTTPTTTATSNNGSPNCILIVTKTYSYYGGSLHFYHNWAYAEFWSDLQNTSSNMQVGGVSFNGQSLMYSSVGISYIDSITSLNIVPGSWQISGAGPIPSLNFTNNDSLPVYTGYTSLPDTISKNQALTLQVNGVSRADDIYVEVYNSSTGSSSYKTKSPISFNNTIAFTSSDLSSLPIGKNSLSISLSKHNYQHVSNATYDFILQYAVNKQVYIK